jgi:hypothetical protein
MDDAGDRAAMLGFDDDHIPAVALGDDLVLQILRGFLAPQVRLERAAQARSLLPQPLADGLQVGAGVIDDLAGRIDFFAHVGRLAFERRHAPARQIEQGKRSGCAANRQARLVDGVEEVGEREQPQRLEGASLHGERGENLGQVARRAQREQRVLRQIPGRLARRRQKLRDTVRLGRGRKPPEALLAQGRQREAADGLDDAFEFEGPQGCQHRFVKDFPRA